MYKKLFLLIGLSILTGWGAGFAGFNSHQALSLTILFVSILGTLLFWEFRLSFAFLGSSVLLITKTIDLEHFMRFASLDVILFLIGMMIIVALLKEAGFFAWIVSLILRTKNLNATKLIVFISVISALLSCAIGEVICIIFIVAAIFEICDYFEVDPTPYIIISVLATNIGSAGTVLGNPIGVLIATKAGLTFEDFLVKAFPLMWLSLIVVIGIVILWFRKDVAKLNAKMKELGPNDILIKLISVPPDRQLKQGLGVFAITVIFLSLHHRIEILFGLAENTLLIATPLIAGGMVMLWKWRQARDYIEKDVEWWTLLFFMLLFAQAGALKYTGATDVIAKGLSHFTAGNAAILIGIVLWTATIGSSILDNVILVAAFIPVIQSFQQLGVGLSPLWWALLFGGCFGGNITLVGSTANIVALGILEKERHIRISFFKWFWIGLVVGVVSVSVVWVALVFLPFYR